MCFREKRSIYFSLGTHNLNIKYKLKFILNLKPDFWHFIAKNQGLRVHYSPFHQNRLSLNLESSSILVTLHFELHPMMMEDFCRTVNTLRTIGSVTYIMVNHFQLQTQVNTTRPQRSRSLSMKSGVCLHPLKIRSQFNDLPYLVWQATPSVVIMPTNNSVNYCQNHKSTISENLHWLSQCKVAVEPL